jgi:hypothetical protein
MLEWQFKIELKNTSLHSLKIVEQNTYIQIIDTLVILITIT